MAKKKRMITIDDRLVIRPPAELDAKFDARKRDGESRQTTRRSSKSQIEKLIRFFEQNIHQLKSQSFNETQARQQLIDPFFESLGWDVHNRSMKPLFAQEVVPEGRVKTTLSKEVREQEALSDKQSTLGRSMREYASILDYIAEDNYKASSKEAIKKPDYRFRIGGKTKFFVEAKKPFVDLSKSNEAIFQVKRYGFSGRVPLSILTDFEEFRAFDCTHRPQYDKPRVGIIKEFDLRYEQYLDEFDHLYDTFSREAVEAGSLDTLTRKLLRKKTGDFALDKHFLEDLSRWREELARDIAKHPRNRGRLNDYTLNESVQRILDRIVFFRVCEDREIEVENTLLAILQMWQGRPGISLYSLLNDLFKQRRSLYNGLLFAPHGCEELEVGDEVLLKILEGLNYPFSPYYFNEIGVEILGSIYEKFLGKTIHLTPKTVRVQEKPEVRKAGGVYYTPQYIVDYIVDNTIGKLLYDASTSSRLDGSGTALSTTKEKEGDHPERSLSEAKTESKGEQGRKLKLSPKQVSKLRIIDIACGSGSFLLGAFQKLIDYHVEWYQNHPKDIQTVNNAPDAYKDANGNLQLSPRKKRDILVNNIYGVDIDRQAVEVTQMSLYLKVLEGENAETLNPQMTLALKEVYLPELTGNIKCGNSLIGTDFTSQGALFDDEMRHKVNPFDWEAEFKQIIEDSGFHCVIGNPPWIDIKGLDPGLVDYYFQRFKTTENRMNVYAVFMERAIDILGSRGLLGYIIPNSLLTQSSYTKLRRLILSEYGIQTIVRLADNVFENVTAETMILLLSKGRPSKQDACEILVFERAQKIERVETREVVRHSQIDQKRWEHGEFYVFNIFSASAELELLRKIEEHKVQLEEICEFTLGITPYDKYRGHTINQIESRIFHSARRKNKTFKPLLSGEDIRRYIIQWGKKEWISYGDWLGAPREKKFFTAPRIIVRQIVSGKPLRIYAGYTEDELYNAQVGFNILLRKGSNFSLKYILGILNSRLMNFYHKHNFLDQSKEVFQKILIQNAKKFPIPASDPMTLTDKQMHDELVALVDQTLELHKQLNKASFESEKESIQRQIAATDRKIDKLVYRLYNLSEEEVKIIESSTS